jgi:hypothetical protein
MTSPNPTTPRPPTPGIEKPAFPDADTEIPLTDKSSNSDDDITQSGPAPDGGTRAWLNAFAGFCIFFGCLGFTSCFGVLQEYYSKHQLRDRTPDEIAWIGSLAGFMQFAGGAIGGPAFDRYGAWVSYALVQSPREN